MARVQKVREEKLHIWCNSSKLQRGNENICEEQNVLNGFFDNSQHSKFIILSHPCSVNDLTSCLRGDCPKMTNDAVPVYTKRGQY